MSVILAKFKGYAATALAGLGLILIAFLKGKSDGASEEQEAEEKRRLDNEVKVANQRVANVTEVRDVQTKVNSSNSDSIDSQLQEFTRNDSGK